jgi:hypothetical protein
MEDSVLLKEDEDGHHIINLVFKNLDNISCKSRQKLLLDENVRH